MSDIPSPQDVISFIVFFFPGFISLLVIANLAGSDMKDRSPIEVIVVSFVFSAISFAVASLIVTAISLAGPNLVIPISTSGAALLQVETTPADALVIFASSVFIGILTYVLLGAWLTIGRWIAKGSIVIRRRLLGRTETFGPSSEFWLQTVFEARDKNDLIVTTKSGELYRGRLASYSIKPKFEVLLGRGEDIIEENGKETIRVRPVYKFREAGWEELAEWAILFPEEDISRMHAVGV